MYEKYNKIHEFFKKRWVFIFIVLLVVLGFFSSIEIIREEVLEIESRPDYEESDSIYLSCEEIDTLNPIASLSEDMYHLSQLIYNSLFDYDETLNIAPELVDSYTVDTEKGTVTLKLKKGVKWHDGESFKANDVLYTVNAIKSVGKNSVYYPQVSKISAISVKGNDEVEIRFSKASNAALDNLIFPILPSHQYGSPGKLASAKDNFKPVGTGLYQYESYDYLSEMNLKPNNNYFGKKATKYIRVMILPDQKLAANMMEINSVTCYINETAERKSVATDNEYQLYDFVSNEVDFIVFNTENDLTKKKGVRQAIATAINLENILSSAYMNDGVLTDTIYYPGFCSNVDTGIYYAYDANEAKSMLKGSGYEDKDQDGYLEDKEGELLELTIVVNKSNSARTSAAQLIRKNLESIGFKVKVEALYWDDYKNAIKKGDYDLLLTGYSINAQYDLRDFFNGEALWKYENEKLLNYAEDLEKAHTAEEYSKIFGNLKSEMMDQLPYYCLCYKKAGLLGVSGFEAPKISTFHDHYRNIETWSWSYEVEKNEEE